MLTNTSQDFLIDSEYKFTINSDEQKAMSEKGRFYITFSLNTALNVNEISDNSLFYTYSIGKTLNVVYQNSSDSQATVDIYNILGQKVISEQAINNGIHQYLLDNGCYIVRLLTNNKVYTKKLTINN